MNSDRHLTPASPSSPTRPVLAFTALLTLFWCAGCGGHSSVSPHPVDAGQARDLLKEVLQGWQEGKPIDHWRSQTPEIVVQDMDWISGYKLTEYQVLDEGTAVDANLHVQVKLVLTDSKGEKAEKTVTYLVTTSPGRSVFRQMIP